MHPKKFWNEFRLTKWSDKIFIGMWFDDHNVQTRYYSIIKQAVDNAGLVPLFLKEIITGDSIPVDIMKGIIECKLVLFDVSSMHNINGRSIRNSNVMYELGLAHTWRNPEEVIVIRDDSEALPFDVQSFGVLEYNINNAQEAIAKIEKTIRLRLSQVENIKKSMVRRAIEGLSIEAYNILINSKGRVFHVPLELQGSPLYMLGIPALLNLGLIEMRNDTSGFGYHITQLGREVIRFFHELNPGSIPLEPDDIGKYKTLNWPDYE